MLIVNYDRKMGWLILTQTIDGQPHDFKVDIDWCNGLCAFIYEYTDKEGKDMAQLMNFFADETHIQNMIKDKHELFMGTIKEIHLNMAFKELRYVQDYFLQMGHQVITYYEPEKKPS